MSADAPITQEDISRLGLLAKKDDLLDGLIIELGNHNRDDLRQIADDSERVSPNGWLHKMIREYLDVWG